MVAVGLLALGFGSAINLDERANLLVAQVGGAPSQECGAAVPCFCGDTVVADYTLTGDLRTRSGAAVCPGGGLILGKREEGKRGPRLNCAGWSITGSDAEGSKGIDVAYTEQVGVIQNCKISHFASGVYHGGGGPSFALEDSELFNNQSGVLVIGSRDEVIRRNNIHHQTGLGAIVLDETLRVEISDNWLHDNSLGLYLAAQGPRTTDLTLLPLEQHKIWRNVIEDNTALGIDGSVSASEFIDNTVRRNQIALLF